MNDKTHPLSPLLALSEKATQREWRANGRYIGTVNHMSLIGECRDQDGTWSDTPKSTGDAEFICALVNWFRSEGKDLAELVHYWQLQHAAALRVIDELRAANARGDGVGRMVEDLRVAAADAGNVIENVLWNCTLSDHYNERLNWALAQLGNAYAASAGVGRDWISVHDELPERGELVWCCRSWTPGHADSARIPRQEVVLAVRNSSKPLTIHEDYGRDSFWVGRSAGYEGHEWSDATTSHWKRVTRPLPPTPGSEVQS